MPSGHGRATPPANTSPQALARFRSVRLGQGRTRPLPRQQARQPAQCARGLVRPALQAGRAPRRPASPPGSATHSKRRRGRPGRATGSGLRTTTLLISSTLAAGVPAGRDDCSQAPGPRYGPARQTSPPSAGQSSVGSGHPLRRKVGEVSHGRKGWGKYWVEFFWIEGEATRVSVGRFPPLPNPSPQVGGA